MRVKITKEVIYKVLITIAIFWIADFVMHFTGVGESNYYYTLKLVNSILFAFIWFGIFDSKKHFKKLVFSAVFGTWISFSYLISSYSGFVQIFGVYARNSPPPFVIFGVFLTPLLWWVFHILAFYIGLEVASLIKNGKD